ncbi:hypothetical protein bas27_0180 [Escherichia phage TrudiGerster]|uniref:Uncharacterized protein n=1 Tax=Escherichia phage TrudiGerster TaxID=2851991 RepID=A0AAE7W048_9CAUD|nr:hypothetical protein bas27_0180 [Escherichia phage TrudiGerster]
MKIPVALKTQANMGLRPEIMLLFSMFIEILESSINVQIRP